MIKQILNSHAKGNKIFMNDLRALSPLFSISLTLKTLQGGADTLSDFKWAAIRHKFDVENNLQGYDLPRDVG